MTTTTSIEVNSDYQAIADSATASDITVQNQTDSQLEIYIGTAIPSASHRGLLVSPGADRQFSGFGGQVYARIGSNNPQHIVVITS